MRRALLTTLVLAAITTVPSTSRMAAISYDDQRTSDQRLAVPTEMSFNGGDEVREEFHQTYPLSPTGRVSVENINGAVRITVWDRSEVQVNAVKRAYNSQRLAEAKIDVVTLGDALQIRTKYPDRDQMFTDDEKGHYNNPATVDYAITVPRKARLESIDLVNGLLDIDGAEGDVKGSSVNGRVSARGLRGEAKLSTVNGSVEAVFTQLDESKTISLNSVNGNVSLMIPSNANAIVKASTVHGGITNDFGLAVQDGDYVGHELYGQIGTGGSRIKLGNVNGRIQIKRNQDGAQLSPSKSLLSQKESNQETESDLSELNSSARQIAEEAKQQAREEIQRSRDQVREQEQARREADKAIRDAQREIEQAQHQVEREVRDHMRAESRGTGTGEGRGTGNGRFTSTESKSFTVNGTPHVEVVNYDGHIIVHGWDKSEVMYNATKHGSDEEELKQIVIKAEQQGSSVSIVAGNEEMGGTSNLEIYLPRQSSLNASTNDGRLRVENVSGDLTLRSGDGTIDVSNCHGTLNLNTGDGHIKVVGFEGQLDARTGDGPIMLDGRFTKLAARTGSGSITLAVPADSNFVIETNAEDVTSEGLNVTEDLSPSKRLRRWKVGQGGNVFVITTGEGRVVVRPR